MLLPLIALAAIASAQGNDVHVQDAAQMHAAELLLRGDIRRLIAEAKSHDIGLQRAAMWALGQSGDAMHVQLLIDATLSPNTKNEAIRALYFAGMPAYLRLRDEALAGPVSRRLHAAQVLYSVLTNLHRPVKPDARALLWDLRKSGDARIREIALRSVRDRWLVHDASEVEPFLKDASPMNRQLAIGIIAGQVKDPETTRRILKIAVSDPHAGVRADALSNFGGTGGLSLDGLEATYVDVVLLALRDKPSVANEALELVIRVAGPTGRQAARNLSLDAPQNAAKVQTVMNAWDSNSIRDGVWRLTRSTDRQIRWDAMLASAALRDARAFDLLMSWQAEGPWERRRVLEAVGWSGDSRAEGYLASALTKAELDKSDRTASIKGLVQLESIEHIDLISDFILDRNSGINERSEVANNVARWDSRFVDAVVTIIRDPSDQYMVRGNLLVGLSRLDKERTYDIALWVLGRPEDNRIHWQAVAALGRVGDPRAIPVIEGMLPTGSDSLKRVADRVLKKLRGG